MAGGGVSMIVGSGVRKVNHLAQYTEYYSRPWSGSYQADRGEGEGFMLVQ